MNEQAIIERLVRQYGVPVESAARQASKLVALQPVVRVAFQQWWDTGVVPPLQVEGYTLERLQAEYALEPIAAFLALDWLTREPDKALKRLRRGYDRIVGGQQAASPSVAPTMEDKLGAAVTRLLPGAAPDPPTAPTPAGDEAKTTLTLVDADDAPLVVERQPSQIVPGGALHESADGRWECLLLDPPVAPEVEAAVVQLVARRPPESPLVNWPSRRIVRPRLGVIMRATRNMFPLGQFLEVDAVDPLTLAPITILDRALMAQQVAAAANWLDGHGVAVRHMNPHAFAVNFPSHRAQFVAWQEIVGDDSGSAAEWAAPEVGASDIASLVANRHALAVILYRLLLGLHPLSGRTYVESGGAVDIDEYGRRTMTSAELTPRLRDLFAQVFIRGVRDPAHRPLPGEWQAALWELVDRGVTCANPSCALGTFAAPERHHFVCPWCGATYWHPFGRLPFLRFYRPAGSPGAYEEDRFGLVGQEERTLLRHHAYPDTPYEQAQGPLGQIVGHEGQWYFRNLGPEPMVLLSGEGGVSKDVPPNAGVLLDEGVRVLLGEKGRARAFFTQMLDVDSGPPSL